MKYKLLEDLPWASAGTIYAVDDNNKGDSYYPSDWWHPTIRCRSDQFAVAPEYIADVTWFEPIDERWKPEDKDDYWYIGDCGHIYCAVWNNTGVDDVRYLRGDCFLKPQQATEAAKRTKQTLLDYHKELAGVMP